VKRSMFATLGIILLTAGSASQMFAPVDAADATVASVPASASPRPEPTTGKAALSQGRGRGLVKKSQRKSDDSEYREVLLPAGTPLSLELRSRHASDKSRVEDMVRARLRERVSVNENAVLPAGTEIVGYVTDVVRPGRVKGRARLALRFTVLRHDGDEYELRTKEIERVADSTKGQDAAKVGIGAGAGAAVGAVLGGGDGAVKGAAIGAAAGTGTALATRGDDVRLYVGDVLTTQLTAPLRVRVRMR
jgi:hypothetical protein